VNKPPAKPASEPSKEPAKEGREGARAAWQRAADTARLAAITTSQVLRKLDNSSLSIDDDSAARGKPSVRQGGPMPGGGVNPYESRPPPRGARSRGAHRTAAPTVARDAGDAAKPRSRGSGRERASWWSRLFRRG
jgi:hypothetical protein